MNFSFLQSLDSGSWVLSGMVLLGQVTLLSLGGLLAGWVYRRDAATRHAVACVALVGILGAPVVTSLCHLGGWRLWSVGEGVAAAPVSQGENRERPAPARTDAVVPNLRRAVEAVDRADERPVVGDSEENAALANRVASLAVAVPEVRKPWLTWGGFVWGVLAIWFVGTMVLLGRLVIGFGMARRLVRESVPLEQGVVSGLAGKCELLFGSASRPRILVHGSIGTALATGVANKVVILPRHYVETLSKQELAAVVTHEMAHLARRDPVVGLLQRVAAALYWPHPLVHGLNREISQAREEICDNFVLQQQPSVSYAELLLRLVQAPTEGPRTAQPAGWTIGFIDPRWKLEDRIAGILDPRRLVAVASRRWLWGTAGIVAVGMTAVLAGIRSPQAEQAVVGSQAGNSTPCRVVFSDGSELELLGVGEYPSNESAWWRPDGTVLDMKPKQPGPGLSWTDKSKVGRGFSFANSHFDLNSTLEIVGQSSEIEGGNVKDKKEILRRQITSERIFDEKEESATITVEYSSAPWKTIHEWNAKSGQGSIQTAAGEMVAHNTAGERDGGTLVSATYRLPPHQAARIVAVDQEGKEFAEGTISRMGVGKQAELTMLNVVISRLPLAKVKTFRFQTQRLETAEFRGVSLRRGKKTGVAVFLNGKPFVESKRNVTTPAEKHDKAGQIAVPQ